jgi:hypothetical protein
MAVRLKQRAATEERVEARKNATCSRPEEGGCNPDGEPKTSSPLTSPSRLALTRVMTHGRRWDSAKADEGEPPPSRRFKDRVVVRQKERVEKLKNKGVGSSNEEKEASI